MSTSVIKIHVIQMLIAPIALALINAVVEMGSILMAENALMSTNVSLITSAQLMPNVSILLDLIHVAVKLVTLAMVSLVLISMNVPTSMHAAGMKIALTLKVLTYVHVRMDLKVSTVLTSMNA